MYCVKCGVKLQDGETKCPLCNTPVMIKENIDIITSSYSLLFPNENKNKKYTILGLLSTFYLIALSVIIIVCFNLYHSLNWGGIVIVSLIASYSSAILPFWFKKYNPMIFIPVTFASVNILIFYINYYTNGKWFLTFGLPLTIIIFLIVIISILSINYLKISRLITVGSLLILYGLSTLLIEFFQTITFNTTMFQWSLITLSSLFLMGLFLIICGIIKPLREFIERKFFI